jgi:hypothetical protein
MEQINTSKSVPEIVLGFSTEAKNTLLTQSARLTPSKIGGKPVWLCPLNTPSEKCGSCKTNLVFLGQVYCDLASHPGMKRMLYLFVCCSENCIQLGRAFAYRCLVPETNEFV